MLSSSRICCGVWWERGRGALCIPPWRRNDDSDRTARLSRCARPVPLAPMVARRSPNQAHLSMTLNRCVPCMAGTDFHREHACRGRGSASQRGHRYAAWTWIRDFATHQLSSLPVHPATNACHDLSCCCPCHCPRCPRCYRPAFEVLCRSRLLFTTDPSPAHSSYGQPRLQCPTSAIGSKSSTASSHTCQSVPTLCELSSP